MKKSIDKAKLESVRENLKNLNTVTELILVATMYIEQKAICFLENNLKYPEYLFSKDSKDQNFNQILRFALSNGFLSEVGYGYASFPHRASNVPDGFFEEKEIEELEKESVAEANSISYSVICWCLEIGSLRNKFAHRLEYKMTSQDKRIFESLNTFYSNDGFGDEVDEIRNAVSILFCIIE